MPLYEYQCDACGYLWEDVFKMDDNKIPLSLPCSRCDEFNCIRRVFSDINVIGVDTLKCDKRMEDSGVQKRLEEIRDHHPKADMKWKG